jgi:glycerol-3-phosphate acyltransferase PlsY
MFFVALLVGAYLLGSIPFSYLVARLYGVGDVRKVGSGNVGATNVMRSAGRVPGVIAFGLDFLKGATASVVAMQITGSSAVAGAAAAVAVLGHMYPVWLGFKGGKGVATGAGAFLPLAPAATGIALVVFVLALVTTRYVSLSSIAATMVLAVSSFLLGAPPAVSRAAAGIGLLVLWKHRANIERIARGTESRVGSARAS